MKIENEIPLECKGVRRSNTVKLDARNYHINPEDPTILEADPGIDDRITSLAFTSRFGGLTNDYGDIQFSSSEEAQTALEALNAASAIISQALGDASQKINGRS